jgi:hypothetical protein
MIGKLTFLICWMVVLGTPLHGADSDAQQRHLMDGAKKEGKLVFYTSVEVSEAWSETGRLSRPS